MQTRLMTTSVAVAALLALALPAVAQEMAEDAPYAVPRTVDGHPDLQGIWTNASVTVLERNAMVPALVLTPEQAKMYETMVDAALPDNNYAVDDGAPKKNDDVWRGYNKFWIDPGAHLAIVNGEIRSSWLVEPADGKLPWSEEGRKIARANGLRNAVYENPEELSAGVRCTVGFGSTGGPPMLNVIYNNHYQFVQTADHVVIQVEMNHDARIIPLVGDGLSDDFSPWLGDSRGHWDGDTLVVVTDKFHAGQGSRGAIRHRLYMSPNAQVTERFTRVSEHEIFYEFTVDDPDIFTQPWRGEMALTAAKGPLYEYACHEGNYSMPGILGGAREKERQAAAATASSSK